MNTSEHLMTCLAEEGVEVALEMSKVAHKANRFGCSDRNVLNPTGPTNAERLVSELNDLLAVADMLAEQGVIPHTWRDPAAQIAKREKVIKFMEYAKENGSLEQPKASAPVKKYAMIIDEHAPEKTPEGEPLLMQCNAVFGAHSQLRAQDQIQTGSISRPSEYFRCHPKTWDMMTPDQQSQFYLVCE